MSIVQALEALPTTGLTVEALNVLDKVVPGEWSNVTRFDAMVAEVCGPDAPAKLVAQVRQTALAIENRDAARYSQALQIYQLVDRMDQAAGAVAALSKVSDLFGGFGVLDQFTPKPATTQAVDAGLKLIAELLAFGRLHGLPKMDADGLARFTGALADYGRYDLIRIAAWVVFDGVLPLGPDFVSDITSTWRGLATSALKSNGVFEALAGQLPGNTVAEKQGFVIQTLDTTGDWVNRFVADKGITQSGVMAQIDQVMSLSSGGMDVVAAAIDASTSYTAHTGTQTVARALARAAHGELKDRVWREYVAGL